MTAFFGQIFSLVITGLIVWGAVVFFKKNYQPSKGAVPDNAANYICTVCNEQGNAVFKNKGNGVIEFILYLCLVSIPLGLVYSIWRRTNRDVVCGSCKGSVIPLNSPAGKKLAQSAAVLVIIGLTFFGSILRAESAFDKSISILAKMPTTEAVPSVSHQCAWIQTQGQLPIEFQGRCSQAYVEQARIDVIAKDGHRALSMIAAAEKLGVNPARLFALKNKANAFVAQEAAKNKKAVAAASEIADRTFSEDHQEFVAALRERFLDVGLDVKVKLIKFPFQGAKIDLIKLTYPLAGDVFAHSIGKVGGVADDAGQHGIQGVLVTDGEDYQKLVQPN